jgi:hypothetical protein
MIEEMRNERQDMGRLMVIKVLQDALDIPAREQPRTSANTPFTHSGQ